MGLNTQVPDLADGFGNVYTIFMNHGNNVPADNLEYFFGWRIGLGPETASTFNNKALNANIKSVIRSVQISWRVANIPSSEIVPFYLHVWDSQGVLKVNRLKVAESPIFLIAGGNSGWCYGQLQDVHLMPNDQIMMSYIQTWATNPSNLLISAQLFCERVG